MPEEAITINIDRRIEKVSSKPKNIDQFSRYLKTGGTDSKSILA
jgi:hypothetical protein